MMPPRHFVLRVTRYGPLVPARLQWIDYEPGEPDNHRDRWPSVIPFVDIAGEVVPPEELTERFMAPVGHWKYAQPISEADYRFLFDHLRWLETVRPNDPVLQPRRRVDPQRMQLPSFEREREFLRRG
jgi:hypothetical protein